MQVKSRHQSSVGLLALLVQPATYKAGTSHRLHSHKLLILQRFKGKVLHAKTKKKKGKEKKVCQGKREIQKLCSVLLLGFCPITISSWFSKMASKDSFLAQKV